MVKLSVSVSASVNLDVKTIGIRLSVTSTIGLTLEIIIKKGDKYYSVCLFLFVFVCFCLFLCV